MHCFNTNTHNKYICIYCLPSDLMQLCCCCCNYYWCWSKIYAECFTTRIPWISFIFSLSLACMKEEALVLYIALCRYFMSDGIKKIIPFLMTRYTVLKSFVQYNKQIIVFLHVLYAFGIINFEIIKLLSCSQVYFIQRKQKKIAQSWCV